MPKPIIEVSHLSKRYRLGYIGGTTLREELDRLWLRAKKCIQESKNLNEKSHRPIDEYNYGQAFWALKDISFDVQEGEVLGVIGRNGAGKSTLLKILSRITEPTEGEATLRGRVSSLLEVGTGFHPELTGRENVYLNGTIHGLRKKEIDKKFDEIVAFSGVEEFIDTPTKRYSSGMAVRLAFAVAAHLEPEILIVDEVLAVGDANFQKRCIGKMREVASGGRTVLFVSHNMSSIARLCDRAIYLTEGKVAYVGSTTQAIRHYLDTAANAGAERVWTEDNALRDNYMQLDAIRVINHKGKVSERIDISQPLSVEVDYQVFTDKYRLTAVLHFINSDGTTLFASNEFNNPDWSNRSFGKYRVKASCKVPENIFAEGNISILVALCSYNPNRVFIKIPDAVSFQVVDEGNPNSVRGISAGSDWPGVVRPWLDWESESTPL